MYERPSDGFPIVLTADGTLMADFRTLLEGMLSASQTTTTPAALMRALIARPIRSRTLAAPRAPLGLRRVEAALLADGFDRRDVVIATPEKLARVVGDKTRIIGISTGDPLGIGMNSTTMTGIGGGRPYTSVWFERLVRRVRLLCPDETAAKVKVVVGGPGAWQLVDNAAARRRLGIDHVVVGRCENDVAGIFRRICDGEKLPMVVECNTKTDGTPPAILGPTVMGVVEISRGCGLGCAFCTEAGKPMVHLPIETILNDVRTNVSAGVRDISLVSEDAFRFGGNRGGTNAKSLIELLHQLRTIRRLRRIQLCHANVSSVAHTGNDELAEVCSLLADDSDREHYPWVNVGVESASGQLLAASGIAKMHPFKTDQWNDVCRQQVCRLASAGFAPMVSLLVGLPGETDDDVELTLNWVQSLRQTRVTVFPMFVAPLNAKQRAFTVADMTPTHWQLFRECYRLNFKWLPRMYWDDQTAAGVPLWRRTSLQALGKLGIPFLKTWLALKSNGITT